MAYTTIKKPSDYFNTKLYTGDGTDGREITGVGFQPDWCWFKARSTAYENQVYDVVRGATKRLVTNDTTAEGTQTNGLQSFDSDGFTVGNGNGTNVNAVTYASWNWLANGTGVSNTDGSITSTVSANTTSGFSIVTWTGNATASQSVGHGLNAVPKVILTKNTDSGTQPWKCYFSEVGNADYLQLNTTDVPTTSGVWDNTTPSSSLIYISNDTGINGSGNTIVAYCFAEKQGFSKFGSYIGNGNSSNGTFVYLGFKPAFIIFKMIDNNDWYVFDNKRDGNYNPEGNKYLFPNSSIAEGTATTKKMDFLSNGFKLYTADGSQNQNGTTYIYMAFAEEPLVGDNPCTAR
jgi:hypothetical protein